MSKETSISLRNQVIYQIYPRQYSKAGTFQAVTDDLDRIKDLGVDIIYFLPIHPIGEKGRKGVDGCPYSISDYYGIAEELGTLEDFKVLCDQAHQKGLKVMIDIVFNHTSRDSFLTKTHPDWFYKNEDGTLANRVGEWTDVTDLTYKDRAQWDYLIDNLVYWANIVDGFRCDVAPLVPLDFWKEARAAVEKVSTNHIWLTESVHYGFIQYVRSLGFDAFSDGEMYQVFDIAYDYDIDPYYEGYLRGDNTLDQYLQEVMKQEAMYPNNYIKLRAYENHDKSRLRAKTKSELQFKNLLALSFFLKGTTMLYNGVEVMSTKTLTLFDKDPIDWQENNDITPFLKKLIALKKHPLLRDGYIQLHHSDGGAVLSYQKDDMKMVGMFNVEASTLTNIPLEDGTYVNEIDHEKVSIKNQTYDGTAPVWIKIAC